MQKMRRECKNKHAWQRSELYLKLAVSVRYRANETLCANIPVQEPVGTHGAMKCLFDGVLQQRDSICISLYKRAFPKWPAELTFA